MKYILLNTIFLLVIVSVVFWLFRLKIHKALIYTLAIVLVQTVVFDSLIIQTGIVDYNVNNILGIYLWSAPVEDFAYAIAAVVLVSGLWNYYETRQ